MPVSTETERALASQSVPDLTQAVVGRRLSLQEMLDLVGDAEPATDEEGLTSVWVGSIGYETYREVSVFAGAVAKAGVEQLIDVRELPISRKRGFAKTALSQALEAVGVKYIHLRSMGNPKELRDLYKSGKVTEGRTGYQEFLLASRPDALQDLASEIRANRSALMCVEDDQCVCHRDVIFDALRDELGLSLRVEAIR